LNSTTHIYTFPKFILRGNGEVTLHSGKGLDTIVDLYWENHGNSGTCPAIWNNAGDTLYLRDSRGNLVLEYSY